MAVEPHRVDERARRVERRLERPLLVAALLTVPAIAIEQSDVGEPWDTIALVLNWTIWLAFVAEVVVMLRVVPDKVRWLRDHPLDLAIVLLTPPSCRRASKRRACSGSCVCCGSCARRPWRGGSCPRRPCETPRFSPC